MAASESSRDVSTPDRASREPDNRSVPVQPDPAPTGDHPQPGVWGARWDGVHPGLGATELPAGCATAVSPPRTRHPVDRYQFRDLRTHLGLLELYVVLESRARTGASALVDQQSKVVTDHLRRAGVTIAEKKARYLITADMPRCPDCDRPVVTLTDRVSGWCHCCRDWTRLPDERVRARCGQCGTSRNTSSARCSGWCRSPQCRRVTDPGIDPLVDLLTELGVTCSAL